jgi:hypothetical protein
MTSMLSREMLTAVLRRRVTILVGHFGAGKTELAINLALELRQFEAAVTLVDLDVVKPYFRSRTVIDELESRGVELVSPRGELLQADLPVVVPQVRASVGLAAAGLRHVLIDVGGAEVGARVLGSIPGLDDPSLTDVLFVVNGSRPFAETPEAVVRMLREVEQASRLRVTALVANTHLMHETTVAIVRAGLRHAEAVGRETGLPIRCCAVEREMVEALAAAEPERPPLLPIERHIMRPLDVRRAGPRRRSSIV